MVSSIQSYVNSLCSIHQLMGHKSLIFSSLVTKAIIRGTENFETSKLSFKHARKVFTLPLLKLLGHKIAKSKWSDESKRICWACTCTSFFECFRIGELLANSKSSFDPSSTLLWGDLKLRSESCMIHIKNPKSKKKEGEFVDLFEFHNKTVCPVKCLKSLEKCCNYVVPLKPIIMFENGTLLTPAICITGNSRSVTFFVATVRESRQAR